MTMEAMEKRLAELELLVAREQDRHEIENLFGAVHVNHSQKNMHKSMDYYALTMPDVSVEVGDKGIFVGVEGLEKLFCSNYQIPDNHGNMLIHWLTTPMIEVAKDGQTARAVWWSPGAEAVKKPDGSLQALWNFITYPCDFIKENGVWKVWHMRIFNHIKCDYDRGWCRDYEEWVNTGPLPGAQPVLPTYHNPYSPQAIQEAVPACPEPYDTWTDASWIFANVPDWVQPPRKEK